MIINRFFVIRFPSGNDGPDLYGLATQVESDATVGMKNGRSIAKQELIIHRTFNPDGLVEMAELEQFYSDEGILKENSPFDNKEMFNFTKSKRKSFGFTELYTLIRAVIDNPVNISDICEKSRNVTITTLQGSFTTHPIVLDSYEDIYEHWLCKRKSPGHKFQQISFHGHFLWKEQRETAEKDFFVIKQLTGSYIIGKTRNRPSLTNRICWAKQFLTEDEVYRYLETHKVLFGKEGFEVIGIKGMNMEEGLSFEE